MSSSTEILLVYFIVTKFEEILVKKLLMIKY